MEALSRKEREARVIALYEKGKTYREIAKELRMSPNTIKAILSREGLDQSTSINSRAFELFSEGKTPLDIAIKLNLRADEAIRLHHEYFMLLGCNEFTKVYPQIKDDPWPFVNLYRLIMEKQMSTEHVMKLLEIANNDLPLIELKYENLKKELNLLDYKKNNANKDYRLIYNEVSNLQKERDQLRSIIEQLRLDEIKVNQQKERMTSFIKNFQNNNETCSRIKEIVKREIENTISLPKHLIRIAIASIFESERMNPGKLQALYYNTSPTLSVERLLSQSSISQNQPDPIQFGYNNDFLEKLILDEAEQLYNKFAEALTSKSMNQIKNDSDHMSQLSNMFPSQSTHAIPDAPGDEISIGRNNNNNINLTDDFIVMDDVLIPRQDRTKYDSLNEFHESTQSLYLVE